MSVNASTKVRYLVFLRCYLEKGGKKCGECLKLAGLTGNIKDILPKALEHLEELVEQEKAFPTDVKVMTRAEALLGVTWNDVKNKVWEILNSNDNSTKWAVLKMFIRQRGLSPDEPLHQFSAPNVVVHIEQAGRTGVASDGEVEIVHAIEKE